MFSSDRYISVSYTHLPALYGAAPVPACGETCPARDAMETKLLALALEQDKPVLGICRGIDVYKRQLR